MKTSLRCLTRLCDICTKPDCDCAHHEVAETQAFLNGKQWLDKVRHPVECEACRMRHPSSYQPGGTIDQFMPVENVGPKALQLMYGDGGDAA